MMTNNKKIEVRTKTIDKYLSAENRDIQIALGKIISAVQAAASQSIDTVQREREIISDVSDYLDGVLSQHLKISQVEELRDIALLSQELEFFFDRIVFRRTFPDLYEELTEKTKQLKAQQKTLKKYQEQEQNKNKHNDETSPATGLDSHPATSKSLFENAFHKADKVIEQNKITRFVSSAIFRFHEEFDQLEKTRDVGYISKLFKKTIEPFQLSKVSTDDNGQFTKHTVNTFSNKSYQNLFLFFYSYYNELLDLYEKDEKLPSPNEELDRILRKEPVGVEKIISQMHAKRTALRF